MLSRTQRNELRRVFGAEGSRMLKLLDALDAKDALIADLIELAYSGFGDIDSGSSRRQHRMALEELKAKAEQ